MKVAVVGSRSIYDRDEVETTLRSAPYLPDSAPRSWDSVTLISGGADGVDTSASLFAEKYGVSIQVIEPDYNDWSGDEHPAKRRNTEIVERSDFVIAIWDGHSNGTRDTIDKALDRGVPVLVEVVE